MKELEGAARRKTAAIPRQLPDLGDEVKEGVPATFNS